MMIIDHNFLSVKSDNANKRECRRNNISDKLQCSLLSHTGESEFREICITLWCCLHFTIFLI